MFGIRLALGAAAVVAFAQSPPAVPYTLVQIAAPGSSSTATYRAYQASPADGVRIVCQEPCSVAANLISAKYAGMKLARAKLLELTGGVDHVPEGAPFDYHLQGDSVCGAYHTGLTGDAGFYPQGGSYGCFWDVEKTNVIYPFTVENAQRIEAQLLFVHEYGHTLFYDRHNFSYEDAVKAFSIYVSGINAVPPGQADFCDPSLAPYLPLFHELCLRNGFRPADFAPAMRELDRVFQAGLGTGFAGSAGKPVTTVRVFKRLLDSLLGSDTQDAFLAVAFTPEDIGGEVVLPAAGGRVSFVGGAVVLDLPPGALAQDTPLVLDSAWGASNIANLSFSQIFRLLPNTVAFSKPVRLTVRYNPASLEPPGASETRLKLWKLNGVYPNATGWSAVSGQQLDTTAHTISGDITAAGQYGYFIQ